MANDAIIGAEIDAEPVEQSIGDFIGEQIDAAEASDIEPAPAVEENRDRAEEEPAPQEEAVEVSAEKTDEASAEPENEAITAPQCRLKIVKHSILCRLKVRNGSQIASKSKRLTTRKRRWKSQNRGNFTRN